MDVQLEFRLPSAGDGALKAEIVEWFVTVGQRVDPGDLLCTVETEKSMVDLTAPFTGWVTRLGGEVGEVLEIGSILVTASLDPPPGAAADDGGHDEPQIVDDEEPAQAGEAHDDPEVEPGDTDRTPTVSPMVRRLAEEFGVDLDTLTGSGPDGRITRARRRRHRSSRAPGGNRGTLYRRGAGTERRRSGRCGAPARPEADDTH